MAPNVVEIILKGVNKTGKLFKETEKSTKNLQTNLRKIAALGVGIAATGIALKKAFDLGEQGAIVVQTRESFEMLLDKVRAAPDLLDQLTSASRGTISQMGLMSSTATLLAGTTGDVAEQLAAATPQLLEIAKAANKLNPALGDTAFFYQSIATGVKRAQPLILDNLGLTIKVGQANEKYALELGKTVDQLTAQEKTVAILNATLEAGKVMIDQVGGSTESASDSFQRFSANIANFGDNLATQVTVAFPALLETLNEYLETQQMIADAEREFGIQKKLFLDDFTLEGEVIAKNVDELREWIKEQKLAEAQQRLATQAAKDARTPLFNLNKEIRDGVNAAQEAAQANRDVVLSLSEITQAELAREVLEELDQAWQEGTISTEEYKDLFEETARTIGGLDKDTIDAQLALFDLRQEISEHKPELEDLIGLYRELGRTIGAIPWALTSAVGGVGGVGGGGGVTTTPAPGPSPAGTPTGGTGAQPFGSTQIFNIHPSSELDTEEMVERIAQRVSEN